MACFESAAVGVRRVFVVVALAAALVEEVGRRKKAAKRENTAVRTMSRFCIINWKRKEIFSLSSTPTKLNLIQKYVAL
jgi:hypothetical protein